MCNIGCADSDWRHRSTGRQTAYASRFSSEQVDCVRQLAMYLQGEGREVTQEAFGEHFYESDILARHLYRQIVAAGHSRQSFHFDVFVSIRSRRLRSRTTLLLTCCLLVASRLSPAGSRFRR